MKYNIAIIPPDNICKKSISVSEMLHKRGGKFLLGNKTNFAHITFAHFECFDVKTLSNIVDDFEQWINKRSPFNIEQYKYRLNDGWIDISFEIGEELLLIYKTVFDILQKNNCQKTSDNWDDNLPHITLSKLEDDTNFNIETLPKYDFSFNVDRIGIFELGGYGTNKKLLKYFILEK